MTESGGRAFAYRAKAGTDGRVATGVEPVGSGGVVGPSPRRARIRREPKSGGVAAGRGRSEESIVATKGGNARGLRRAQSRRAKGLWLFQA